MGKIKGKCVCVFSAKGGVGKTVTLLNIAGVLAQLGKKVLLIDFDLSGGDISTYLNVSPKKTIYNFVDDYANKRFNIFNDYVTKYSEAISFLACPKDPRQGIKIENAYIPIILEKAKFSYDVALIDMNHVINEFNINVLDECDKSILVVTNDLLDIKNMRNLIAVFTDAEKTNYRVLLNESISLYKKYYSLYDIKNVIKANIDYRVPNNFFIKTMDKYVADGKILTLEKNMPRFYPKVYKTYLSVCNDIMEDNNG